MRRKGEELLDIWILDSQVELVDPFSVCLSAHTNEDAMSLDETRNSKLKTTTTITRQRQQHHLVIFYEVILFYLNRHALICI